MKNYSFWLKTSSVIQFITAAAHSISFFVTPQPANETEKRFYDLMTSYQFDFGAGFHRSMEQMMTALSVCFPLVCLLGGVVNWYLLYKKVPMDVMKGVLNINIVIFGISFCVMLALTFLPPITLTGLALLTLVISRLTIRDK